MLTAVVARDSKASKSSMFLCPKRPHNARAPAEKDAGSSSITERRVAFAACSHIASRIAPCCQARSAALDGMTAFFE